MNKEKDIIKKDIDLTFFAKLLLIHLSISAIVLLMFVLILKKIDLVDLSPEALTCLPEASSIYDNSNQLITTKSGDQNRIFIDIDNLQHHTIMAFVAAEDARFFSHNGIDIKRIFGALLADIKAGYFKEGASTISQQLIKNSHLSSSKKISRKIQEAILACQLESRYSKNEILEMYLNYIYFGYGSYGIQVASLTYFDKNASELTLSESAALAGLIKSPTNYSPFTNPDAFTARRNKVLAQMLEYGFITNEQYHNAVDEKTVPNHPEKQTDTYGFYIDHILVEASKFTNKSIDDLLNGGYHIYTTLNTKIASFANEIISDPNAFPNKDIECAVVVLDSSSGSVHSIIGGRNYTSRLGFNRATMAKRSPGSTIKPLLVYAPAIDTKKFTAASILLDEKKSFDAYSPNNFNDKYYGNITLRESLIKSLNIPAVEILNTVGIDNCKSYLKKMGYEFDKNDTGLPMALGGLTNGITPLELASCYQVLANEGIFKQTHFIRKIVDNNENEIYNFNHNKSDDKKIYKQETTFIISDILHDAAQKYASPFLQVNSPICAKTGTASYKDIGNSDIWVAAYDSKYTVIVWMGYDKTDEEHHIAQSITGSKHPSKVAAGILKKIYSTEDSPENYIPPSGIVNTQLDGTSLKQGGIYLATDLTPQNAVKTEYFIQGTEPNEHSPYYSVPQACKIDIDVSSGIPIISITSNNDYTFYHLFKISNGEHRLLTTVSGKKGEILSYCDTSAQGHVRYYVIPEHKYIKNKDGAILLGKASNMVEAIINFSPLPDPTLDFSSTTLTPDIHTTFPPTITS